MKKCRNCGVEFVSTNPRQIHCTQACASKYHNRKKRKTVAPEYTAETLAAIEQRDFENGCNYYRDILLKIYQGKRTTHLMKSAQRKNLRRRNILVYKTRSTKSRLTERAINFLGFTTRRFSE